MGGSLLRKRLIPRVPISTETRTIDQTKTSGYSPYSSVTRIITNPGNFKETDKNEPIWVTPGYHHSDTLYVYNEGPDQYTAAELALNAPDASLPKFKQKRNEARAGLQNAFENGVSAPAINSNYNFQRDYWGNRYGLNNNQK